MEHETFWTLLKDPAHWIFEIFLMFLFDFVVGILIWPRLQKALTHHKSDDEKIDALEKEVKRLAKIIEEK
jgi:hypothetical protein